MNRELQMFKPDLEKAEAPEIKLPISAGSQKKQENSRKTSTSSSLTTLKPLTVGITRNCGKSLKRWEYKTTLPASWETCMQVKKQQNLTWNNWLVPNWERSMTSLYICHPAYLTYMQSTSYKMPGWMNHKLDSRLESERKVAQSCPTLCNSMDCSLPGSSLHGILQARVLEWVAISFSWGSSWPRDQTQVSRIPGRHFNLWATREAQSRLMGEISIISDMQMTPPLWQKAKRN